MTEARKPAIKGITPKGIASWPRLHEPDTKYKKEGEYSIKLRLSGAAAEELKAVLDQAYQDSYDDNKAAIEDAKRKEKNPNKRKEIKERADLPYKDLYENDELTGATEFNFKMKASGISQKTGKPWARKPAVFTVSGAVMPADKVSKVGGGSMVKVAYEVSPFWTLPLGAGVSLRLEAVQVIELRSFSDRSASAFGFGSEGIDEAEDSAAADTGFGDESGENEPSTGDF